MKICATCALLREDTSLFDDITTTTPACATEVAVNSAASRSMRRLKVIVMGSPQKTKSTEADSRL